MIVALPGLFSYLFFYFHCRIMRDEDPAYGVFRDPEEYQYYKNMFFNLTEIMSEVGFSEEVSTSKKDISRSVLKN